MNSLNDIMNTYIEEMYPNQMMSDYPVEIKMNDHTYKQAEDEVNDMIRFFRSNPNPLNKNPKWGRLQIFYMGYRFNLVKDESFGNGTLCFHIPMQDHNRLFHNYSFSKQ